MFKVLSLQEEAFGLDINDSSLKIVKLKKKRKYFVLTSFNEVKMELGIIENGDIKKEEDLIKNIKYVCATTKGKKLGTKYVVVSLPEEKSFSQVIQLPKMSEEELRLAVPLEAESYIPMPIGDVYLDFQVIPQTKDYLNYMEVLIAAIPKKIADYYVECLKKAGLIPIAFETESEAIAMSLVGKEVSPSLLVLVDFGENSTNLVVFSGQSVRFTCSIPISSRVLTKNISDSLKISFQEAEKLKVEYGLSVKKTDVKAEKVSRIIAPILTDLTEQIKKYLNFYREHSSYEYFLADKKVEKVLLCGGGAELKGLVDFMSKKLDVTVELGNPLINLLSNKSKTIIKKDIVSYTTAIGLALRQINNSGL